MRKPHVLLAEDNDATRTLMNALLQRDFTVDVVSDGAEAVEKLKTNRYSAVVLDLLMPQLDGFGVLEFLREHNPAALRKVLVVTAALTAPQLSRVKEFKIRGIVAKPFEVETLLNAVKECAGNDGETIPVNILSSGVLLLIADLLRQRFL